MKKRLSFILAVMLLMSMLVGCAPNSNELWNAFVKTSNMKSGNTDVSLTLNFDTTSVKDSNIKLALTAINGTKIDLKSKMLKDNEGIVKVSADATATLLQKPYNFGVWVDMNVTDINNPKFIEMFKFPSNLPNMPTIFSSKYAYMDISEMQKQTGAPQINFEQFKNFMDPTQILDSLKNIDTKDIAIDKKSVGSNSEYSLQINGAASMLLTNQYFETIFNSPMMNALYKGDTLEQSKKGIDIILNTLKNINLFGEDGIKSVITVDPDGYFVEEKSTIDLSIDLAQFAEAIGGAVAKSQVPNEKLVLTIDAVKKYSDINKVTSIDMPQLNNTNSIDIASMSKMSNKGINVLLNGKIVDFEDVNPISINDRTMVPMRKIFESLGASVNYENGVITATKDALLIKHTIGENIIYINDKPIEMDVASVEKDERTLVPVRFISNALGATVDWNEEMKMVIIALD